MKCHTIVVNYQVGHAIFRSLRIMQEKKGTPPPSECFMDGSCSVLFIVKPVSSTSQTSPTAADIATGQPSKETLSGHPISQEIWGGQDRAALVNLITTKMWNLQLLSRLAKGSYPVLAHKGTPAKNFYPHPLGGLCPWGFRFGPS